MITIDEAGDMLDDIADGLPPELFRELNGGVLLLPDVQMHPHPAADDLYILGEYHHDTSMGRYIYIYFGSMKALYGNMSKTQFKKKLRETLLHELTHHNESLAGLKDLDVEDEEDMERYWRRKQKRKK